MSGGQEDCAEVGSKMREAYVGGCKYGKCVVYLFGGAVPTRLEKYFGNEKGTFRPEIVFDASKNKKRDEFEKVVKKGLEDQDRFGNDEIYPSDDLQIVILAEATDDSVVDEIIKDARAKIPDFNNLFDVWVNDH